MFFFGGWSQFSIQVREKQTQIASLINYAIDFIRLLADDVLEYVLHGYTRALLWHIRKRPTGKCFAELPGSVSISFAEWALEDSALHRLCVDCGMFAINFQSDSYNPISCGKGS